MSAKQFPLTGNNFAFLEPGTDTGGLEFVTTVKANGINNASIQKFYFAILNEAQSYGANCFRLNSYSRNDSTNEITLILDTYFATDSILYKLS